MFCKRLNQRFKLVTRRLIWWLDWRYSDRNHVAKTRPVRYKLRSGQGKFYGFTDPTFRNCSEEQGIYSTYVKQIRLIWIWRYRCLFITNRPDQTWIYFTWDSSCYTLKVLLTIIVMKYTAEWKKCLYLDTESLGNIICFSDLIEIELSVFTIVWS